MIASYTDATPLTSDMVDRQASRRLVLPPRVRAGPPTSGKKHRLVADVTAWGKYDGGKELLKLKKMQIEADVMDKDRQDEHQVADMIEDPAT